MKNEDKTREQLISELAELQQRITELELAQQNTNLSSAVLDPSPPRNHFTSGSQQSFISNQAVKKGRKYHISELIDISLLQQLFDSFYELTGIRHAFIDVDTNIIFRTVWSDICLRFHRVCPQTEYRCKQSDSYISSRLQDGPYIKYQCLNGLIEYATPIIVEGQHLATIFLGQLLHEPPDEEYFRQQAQEFGFDEEAYIEALHEVSILPEDGIKPIMVFFSKLAQMLASMGLERLNRIVAAEDNFIKVFHFCPDPVTITNFDTGYYVDVNYAWVEMTGYQKHETVGRSVFEFDAYSCLEERNLILKEVQEKGYARNLEILFRMKSGDMHTFLISIEVIFIDSVPHLLSVYKDITQRKQMEEQLRFSEECFSKAFNTCPVLMALTTLHEGKIIKINDAFCNILGYSREETVGKSILELGIWSNPANRYQILRSIIAKQSIQDMEIYFNKKNGEQRQGLFYAEGLEIDGEQCIISLSFRT